MGQGLAEIPRLPPPASLELAAAELAALEHLRLSMAGSPDLGEVQRRILLALTTALGYEKAAVGLVDSAQTRVGSWLEADSSGISLVSRRPPLPLGAQPLARAFAFPGRAFQIRLDKAPCILVALVYREQPVGALVVEEESPCRNAERLQLLERFSLHAAEALAGVRLCVERAQRLAIEAERNRISVEIHDAVVQSLFAMTCALEGVASKVERGEPGAAAELQRLQRVAEKTLTQLRRSIHDLWPGELLERQFVRDLREHVADFAEVAGGLELDIDVRGHLTSLTAEVRRGLFRVAQEALNNVIRHAQASRARVCLDATGDPVVLTIQDDGHGVATAHLEESLGMVGMRNRLASLNGSLEVTSAPGIGTTIRASIPRLVACRSGS